MIDHFEDVRPATPPPEAPKVVPKVKVSGRSKRQAVIAAILVMACGLAVVSQYAAVAFEAKTVNQLRSELTKEKNALDHLRVDVNRLKSLERVEAVATSKLGMQRPKYEKVLAISAVTGSAKAGATLVATDTSQGEEKPGEDRTQTAAADPEQAPVGDNPFAAAVTRFFQRITFGML
ncbi:cell division protein ftsl [Heliomicrobium modesticaldum Ice1]|uniref:Cell division protein FtsL n=1 Tax=Heliobacterium modesticaldum (strain ATCC 51547 / Ice1) TaxID=498761 RepID=B0TGB3_HELMI|nr:cell division protein ftsl [Heliomicrobium modesticaldum Ice1]